MVDLKPSVEVVVINYKRPKNIPLIINALRSQSVSCLITIVDCHPSEQYQLAENTADRTITVHSDRRAFDRYIPIHFYKSNFTYFHDDDMLPGTRALEHLLDVYYRLDRPGVLGQFAKTLPSKKKPYKLCGFIKQIERPVVVDLIVRGFFVETNNLVHLKTMASEIGPIHSREDDITLCCGLSLYGGLKNYLLPYSKDPEKSICVEELDDFSALCHRSDHLKNRTRALREAYRLGWKRPLEHCTIPLL